MDRDDIKNLIRAHSIKVNGVCIIGSGEMSRLLFGVDAIIHNHTIESRKEAINNVIKLIENQKDMPSEFVDIVNNNFFDLIKNKE